MLLNKSEVRKLNLLYSCTKTVRWLTASSKGHRQSKLSDHVYPFLLFMDSGPRYRAEFRSIEDIVCDNIHFYCGLVCHIKKAILHFLSQFKLYRASKEMMTKQPVEYVN